MWKVFLYTQVLLLMVLTSLVTAASPLEVISLDNGSCWLKEEKKHYAIASFGNAQTSFFGEREKRKILQLLQETDAYWNFHCSSSGARIVVNTEKFCAWVTVAQSKISVISYGRKEYLGAHNARPCYGIRPGSLLLKFTGTFLEIQEWLEQIPGLEKYVYQVKPLAPELFQLVLNKNLRFQEPEVLNELKFMFIKEARVKYLELDFFLHPVGEFYLLFN